MSDTEVRDIPFPGDRSEDTPHPCASLTVEQLQTIVDRWITTIGVRYFSPLTNMAILAEETGEVARIMARRYGDQSFKPGENPDLADELADLIWVAIAIANQTGVNLTEAIWRNIDKKSQRDALRHLNNPKLSTPDHPHSPKC